MTTARIWGFIKQLHNHFHDSERLKGRNKLGPQRCSELRIVAHLACYVTFLPCATRPFHLSSHWPPGWIILQP
ncbi:hypothetical protein LZ31DRAFT_232931 [Colletotrichum somersetense]|nr:hypothetical protein LZ31DRAFT_232931 [Colletotrichum somersetense]